MTMENIVVVLIFWSSSPSNKFSVIILTNNKYYEIWQIYRIFNNFYKIGYLTHLIN
jgi:hypothetical protein